MKIRSLTYPLLVALTASLAVACGGSDVQSNTPPPTLPPPAPTEPAKTPATDPAATTATDPAPAAKKEEPPPAAKPLKEKIVGVWVLAFDGDVKAAAETDAKKKAGKDEKKLADLMKKAEEATAKVKIESTADMMIMWESDKTTSKTKYESVKEEGNTFIVKRVGKDEITKKDAPTAEISITFKDDSTIEFRDPTEKDAKKAKLLTFKKGAASATPATPAAEKGAAGATPAQPAQPATGATTPAKPAAGATPAPAKK